MSWYGPWTTKKPVIWHIYATQYSETQKMTNTEKKTQVLQRVNERDSETNTCCAAVIQLV